MRLKRLESLVLALILALAGWAGGAHAQGATTGSIRGQVASTDGRPVDNAQVIVTNTATGLRRAVVTGADGRYSVPLLPPGSYSVQAQGLGLTGATRTGISVRVGEATPLDFTLTAQAVAIEGITVSGERARIDPTQGGVAQTVTPEQVENLPVQGRDFTDFLNLSPLVSPQPGVGTGGQFSIGGARTSGTNVQIDGADANNQFFGENRGSSRTPFAFSLESIKEFQLITNGFDVEYGNYQGGVVNAVTKGGQNDFRGSAFLFFRDEALTGNDFSGAPPSDYTVQQFGASISGPIVRDRLFFFFSFDGQNKDQPLFSLTPEVSGFAADSIARFTRILRDVYGVQNPEQFFGATTQAEDNLVLFGRIDWNINDNHRFTIRQNYSDFEQTNDRISPSGNEALTRGGPFVNETFSTVAELNSVLGANAFNTLRFQYSDEDRPRNPNEPGGYIPEIRIDNFTGRSSAFFGGDGIIFRNRLVEDKLQLVDNFTYRMGNHALKVGTNNILSRTDNLFYLLGNGAFRFRSLTDFERNRPSDYSRFVLACPSALTANQAGQRVICPNLDVPRAEFSALEWSIYAQDDWQVTDRLLVTPGIRYGGTTFQDQPGQVASVEQAFGIPTGVAPDFSGISPRLAFTYTMGDDQPQVFRGGVGLLVGRVPTVLAGNVFQTGKPLLRVACSSRSGNVPAFNLPELLTGARGANNPFSCTGGGSVGLPEHAVFSDDFELPRTLKANVGYERVVGAATKVGADVIYSRSWNNYNVFDLNLRDQPSFTLGAEGRPVFQPAARFNPTNRFNTARLENPSFERVYYNVSEGEAQAVNVALELDHRFADNLQFAGRYAFIRAYDNSSFSCCTSSEGFGGTPTAGNPNFIGDVGDEVDGTWGPSSFERRHTLVFNFLYNGPWGINASGIWRSTSGTPWTPVVDGDVNGDGVDDNDRAFVGEGLAFATPQDASAYASLLDRFDCLQEQRGGIARRNSCRNPWFHSVDLRLAKQVPTFAGQRAELLVEVFNLLNGLNEDWGRLVGVYGDRAEILQARSFNPTTGQVVYAVNEEFGEERPIGFDPFQFQVQLGLRYRF